MKKACAFVLSFVCFAAQAQQASELSKYQPSFDCAKARGVAETAICTDTRIGQLDGLLSVTYRARMTNPQYGVDKKRMRASQLAWLKKRNACTDPACVEESIKSRVAELCSMPVGYGVNWGALSCGQALEELDRQE